MAEQQAYVHHVNDLACSSNTADILRASGAALQSFSAAETVVNSVVADNTGHPAAVHSVQYSQSVYGPNGQAAAAYQPAALGALPDYPGLVGYLNPDGTPVQNGRVLPSDSVLQQAYPGADSALLPRSPRRPYPDMLPPTAMSPVRQPYAVAYEQVHVMFDPHQVAGGGANPGALGGPQDPSHQQQVSLLSTAAASVSLSPHVLPPAAAGAAGRTNAQAEAQQQMQPSGQVGYGALAAHAGAAWPQAPGISQEQPAQVLQYSVTNTVMANGVGNGANALPHMAPASAPPPAPVPAGVTVNSGLPGLSGLTLPSLAGVSGPVGGSASLGLHSMAVANSATVLSGTSLTLPSGGLNGDLQLSQWPHIGPDGTSGGLGAVLPPTLTRPRPLDALDTVPVASLDKMRREVSRLNGEVERLEKEVMRQKGLRESERSEFTDAKERLKHSWAADREDFARVKEQLKRKNAEHHLQNGRLSQALKESEVLTRGMREACVRCNVPLPAELDNTALAARAETTLSAAARLRAADALIDPACSSAPAVEQQHQHQQQVEAPLANGHHLPNGRHHDDSGSISSAEDDQMRHAEADEHAPEQPAATSEAVAPPVAPTSVKQAASAVAAMMQQLPAALDGTTAGEDAEHAAAAAGTHAQEAAAHGAAAAAAAATALGQLAAALASQAPLPDDGEAGADILAEPVDNSALSSSSQPPSTPMQPPVTLALVSDSALAPAATSAAIQPSAFQTAAGVCASTPGRQSDAASSPSDASAFWQPSRASSAQVEDSAPEAHARSTPFMDTQLHLPLLHGLAPVDVSSSPGSNTSTPMSRPPPQRLGSGRLSGGLAVPPAAGYRSRSGALSGPHPLAVDPPAGLSSLGSGSLAGLHNQPNFAAPPGFPLNEPGTAALHLGHPHFHQPGDMAPAPAALPGFVPGGYNYSDLGAPIPAQAAAARAMLEDGGLARVGAGLQLQPGGYAAQGPAPGSHNLRLGSHGSGFGVNNSPYLFPVQQQALSLADMEAQLGMTTLPPATALEGGVLESEMANDETASWRMPQT